MHKYTYLRMITQPLIPQITDSELEFFQLHGSQPWILGTRATKWSAFSWADNDSASSMFHKS